MAVLLVGMGAGGYLARGPLGDAGSAVVETVGDWTTRLRDLAASEPQTEVGRRSVAGQSASVFLAVGENAGSAAFVLLVSDPDGPPAALVLPQDLLVSVPGFGEFRMVDALEFGGADLAALSVMNEFGIRVDDAAAVPAGAVAGGLVGPVEVDLSVPLFIEDSDGSLQRVLPAGRTEVAPELVEELLVTAGEGDRFEWLQRQGSAWRAVFGAIRTTPAVADRLASFAAPGGGGAADLLVTVAGDSDTILATIPVAPAESASGFEALVPSGEADAFIRERFGHLLLRPEGRPRLEILNGNGRIGTTADISEVLVPAGFRVLRTDNADDFDYEQTLIVAQGDHAEGWAREILELLGRGLLFLETRAPSGVVDVSIIVGHDIPAGQG